MNAIIVEAKYIPNWCKHWTQAYNSIIIIEKNATQRKKKKEDTHPRRRH